MLSLHPAGTGVPSRNPVAAAASAVMVPATVKESIKGGHSLACSSTPKKAKSFGSD